MELTFLSLSKNEAFARATVGAFISQVDPTMDELNEIKTVVSEAVTNSIIHGYLNASDCYITIHCAFNEEELEIKIIDSGIGIHNISIAKEPMYTSKPELERSGMGFSIMESFMDSLQIESNPNEGTTVIMSKQLTKTHTVCH